MGYQPKGGREYKRKVEQIDPKLPLGEQVEKIEDDRFKIMMKIQLKSLEALSKIYDELCRINRAM